MTLSVLMAMGPVKSNYVLSSIFIDGHFSLILFGFDHLSTNEVIFCFISLCYITLNEAKNLLAFDWN